MYRNLTLLLPQGAWMLTVLLAREAVEMVVHAEKATLDMKLAVICANRQPSRLNSSLIGHPISEKRAATCTPEGRSMSTTMGQVPKSLS